MSGDNVSCRGRIRIPQRAGTDPAHGPITVAQKFNFCSSLQFTDKLAPRNRRRRILPTEASQSFTTRQPRCVVEQQNRSRACQARDDSVRVPCKSGQQ